MSFDYAKIATTAARLIENFGADIVIKTPTQSGDEWAPTVTYTETDAIGVQLGYSGRDLLNSSIEIGDVRFLISGVETIAVGDLITDTNGVDWHAVNVETVNPAGLPIIHTVQARK